MCVCVCWGWGCTCVMWGCVCVSVEVGVWVDMDIIVCFPSRWVFGSGCTDIIDGDQNNHFLISLCIFQYNKQEIKWPQLVRLYQGAGGKLSKNSPGYNTVYKLTKDHLELNPSLRMKVKLAAQVRYYLKHYLRDRV